MTDGTSPPHVPPRKGIGLWWLLIGFGMLVIAASVIWWLLASRHPITGAPLIETPGQLFVAIAGGLLALAGAVLPRLIQVERHTAATAEHVVNSHKTNMRDDLDKILAAVQEVQVEQAAQKVQLAAVATRSTETARDVSGLRQEIGLLRQTERDQWAAIEDTAQKNRRTS